MSSCGSIAAWSDPPEPTGRHEERALRIVFMGTPAFACPALELLAAAGHELPLVVSQPDRARGRGQRLHRTPVAALADSLGIAVLQPQRPRGEAFLEQLHATQADAFVVVAYGHILRSEVLEMPPLGCINAHASILPRWRGAAPIQWAIFGGDTETGITTMRMDRGMDTGEMLLTKSLPIGPRENAGELHDRLAPLAAELLVATVAQLPALEGRPQDDDSATLAPRIERADLVLDWSSSALHLDRRIRGLAPAPGARTWRGGKLLKILSAEPVAMDSGTPGEIFSAGGAFCLRCGKGALRLLRVGPAGKAAMSAEAYFRGRPLVAGERLEARL